MCGEGGGGVTNGLDRLQQKDNALCAPQDPDLDKYFLASPYWQESVRIAWHTRLSRGVKDHKITSILPPHSNYCTLYVSRGSHPLSRLDQPNYEASPRSPSCLTLRE